MSNVGNRLQKRNVDRVIPLRLVEASRLQQSAVETLLVKEDTPWNHFNRIYSLKLGENEPFIVAERRRGRSFDLVSISRCAHLSHDQLELLRLIQHPNFVTVQEVYHQDEWHIIMEHMTRSLQEAVGNPFLDSPKLAAITGQVGTNPISICLLLTLLDRHSTFLS